MVYFWLERNMQESLKKNDEIETVIDRLGVNGEGIAVYNNKVIFVPTRRL